MTPDLGNAIFEIGGAWFTWKNAARLYRDKRILGTYWPAWFFFSLWGLWNLWYYPTLGQWLSFLGGCALVSGNLAWCCLAARYMLADLRAPHDTPTTPHHGTNLQP